jgi:predicted nucleic acid-binding protein
MSVFVDTGVFYAHHDTDATRHDTGAAALNRVLREAEYGRVMTSEYVYDEVVTLTQKRTGSVASGVELGQRIRGKGYPDAIELLHSSPSLLNATVDTYETYADQRLSFTDAMTVAMLDHHDIDAVLSFDDDFDGVVDRLAPEDVVE